MRHSHFKIKCPNEVTGVAGMTSRISIPSKHTWVLTSLRANMTLDISGISDPCFRWHKVNKLSCLIAEGVRCSAVCGCTTFQPDRVQDTPGMYFTNFCHFLHFLFLAFLEFLAFLAFLPLLPLLPFLLDSLSSDINCSRNLYNTFSE